MPSSYPSPFDSEIPGSRWWRIDFHTHTPHSSDAYKSQAPTDRQWLLAHMRLGIDCVCITDHNGGKRIDSLKAEYSTMKDEWEEGLGESDFRKIAIFPGVEVTTSDDIHLLAIFSPDAGSSQVSNLLGQIGMSGGQEGDAALQLRDGIKTILESVSSKNQDYLLIPAHVNGHKGLISQGNPRTTQDALAHPSIHSLECHWSKTQDWDEKVKTIQYTNNKVFSTIYGSDSHELDEIGRRTTWVHMEAPTLDALRIALMDGAGSVVEFVHGVPHPGPATNLWLRKLTLNDTKYLGRKSPLTLRFNPGLNTIIGGRGSGKSTLLELIRKAAHRSEDLGNINDSELREQHEGLIKDALEDRPEAEIELLYEHHGQKSRMIVKGPYPPQPATLMEKDSLGLWIAKDLPHHEWRSLYPLRIYSQKELYGFRKGTGKLLQEIDSDSSIGIREREERRQSQMNSLLQTAAKIAEFSAEVGKHPGLKARKEELSRQIRLLEESGHKEILQNYNLRRKQASETKRWDDAHESLTPDLKELAERLQISSLKLSRLPDQPDDQAELSLESKADELSKVYHATANLLNRAVEDIRKANDEWSSSKQSSTWRSSANQAKSAYVGLTEKLSAEQAANPAIYGQLVQQLNTVEEQLKNIESQKNHLSDQTNKKKEMIEEIEHERIALSTARSAFLQWRIQFVRE